MLSSGTHAKKMSSSPINTFNFYSGQSSLVGKSLLCVYQF